MLYRRHHYDRVHRSALTAGTLAALAACGLVGIEASSASSQPTTTTHTQAVTTALANGGAVAKPIPASKGAASLNAALKLEGIESQMLR